MAVDRMLSVTRLASPDAEAKRRLAELLMPGNGRLRGAGIASAASSLATAGAFFAIAAVAQDVLQARTSWSRELPWLLLLTGSALARASSADLAARLAADGAIAVEGQLRSRLLDRLLAGGDLELSSAAQATALIDEVASIGGYAERYRPAQMTTAVVPLLLLGCVFPFSWVVGMLLILAAPLPAINLSIVGMGTAAVANAHAEELRRLSAYFLDRLRGLPTLRALGAERTELTRVREASEHLEQSAMAVLRVAFVSAAVLEAIVTVAVAVVASYIGLTLLGYVHVPGLPTHMSLRTGLFLLLVTPLYFQPVRALAAAYHERADALAATVALAPLLAPKCGPLADSSRALVAVTPPSVTVCGLSHIFPGREAPALADISLSVAGGEIVGISGASGAGKSTLLRLLAGDLTPSAGEAMIDEVPAGELSPHSVTWLGQRPYFFPGTLGENIRIGRSDASDDEVLDAALAVGLRRVLDRLSDGLATDLGEGGWGLSGGEAHRVALARTFLKSAPLLLLDEPTAHLDAESEAAIVDVVSELARDATVLIATHSPAMLEICDRVFSLDRGRLIDPLPSATFAEVA
jgi:ATP-binding cassette subfamily C protein CydD